MPFGLGLIANPSRAPGPTDISSTNVSTNGGSGVITGLNFAQGMAGQNPLAYVLIGTVYVQLTITWSSSSKLLFTLPAGTYTAGTYELTIINPDGQSDTKPIFQITTVSDPQTILGALLFAWYRADSGVTTSSGLVTQWNDKGPNGINLSASGSQRPTFNSASANGFNAQPTITFDGVANTLFNNTTASTFGSNTTFMYVIARYIAATINAVAVFITQAGGGGYTIIQCSGSSAFGVSYGGTSSTSKAGLSTASPSGIYAYVKGTASSAETLGINVANLGEATTTGSTTQPSTGVVQLYLASRANAAGTFANIEIAEVIYANGLPSTSQLNDLYKYANFRYGLDSTLSVARTMDVLSSTGTESRIAGTGFNTTTGVQIVVGGTPTAVTTTFLGSGSVSISGLPSLSAGTYDLIITNTNSGASLFVSSAITATSTKKIDTIFGRNAIAWSRADQVSLNSTTVSSTTDLACAGWTFKQTTGSSQPTYNSSDSNFGGMPSMTFAGSPFNLNATGGSGDQNLKTKFWIIVCRPRSSTPGFLATEGSFRVNVNGPWSVSAGGSAATATFGGSGVHAKVEWRASDAGGGTETLGCAVNFGTESTVTQSGNVSWSSASTIWLNCNQGSTFGSYDIAEIIGLDIVPTGSKLTDLQNYLSGRYGF